MDLNVLLDLGEALVLDLGEQVDGDLATPGKGEAQLLVIHKRALLVKLGTIVVPMFSLPIDHDVPQTSSSTIGSTIAVILITGVGADCARLTTVFVCFD